MKKRVSAAMLAASVLLGTVLTTAPVPVAYAADTMADQFQPSWEEVPAVFPTVDGTTARWLKSQVKLPTGTHLTLTNPNYYDLEWLVSDNVMISTSEGTQDLWIHAFDTSGLLKDTTLEPRILVEYPDGSAEFVTQKFNVRPAMRYKYQGSVSQTSFAPGVTTDVTVNDLPSDATIQVLDSSAGWAISSVSGHDLRVVAPNIQAATGRVTLRVKYSDTSSELIYADFDTNGEPVFTTSEPVPTTTEPVPTSVEPVPSSSSTTPSEPAPTSANSEPAAPTTVTTTVTTPVTTTVRETVTETATTTETSKVVEPTTVVQTSTVTEPTTVTNTVEVPTTVVVENPVPTTVVNTATVTEISTVPTTVEKLTTIVSTVVPSQEPAVTETTTETVSETSTVTVAPTTVTVSAEPTTVTVTTTASPSQENNSNGSSSGNSWWRNLFGFGLLGALISMFAPFLQSLFGR